MGESIISERLRRLREEGDNAESFFKTHKPMARPSGADRRSPDYQPVQVVEQVYVVSDEGEITVETQREAAVANLNSSPFENIVYRGWIRAKDEPESVSHTRIRAARRFRSLSEGAQVKGLKGQSFEISTGQAGVPRPVGDGTIDCMKILGDIRKIVPPTDMEAVEAVLLHDLWIWEGKRGRAIFKEVDRVLRGLDYIAMASGYLTADEVVRRWPAR